MELNRVDGKQKAGLVITIGLVTFYLVSIIALPFIDISNVLARYYIFTLSYLTIAILIWLEKDHLQEFHLDRLTIIFFVAISVIRSPFSSVDPTYFIVFMVLIGISVAIVCWRNWQEIPVTKLSFIKKSILFSAVIVVLTLFLQALQPQPMFNELQPSKNIFTRVVSQLLYNLSFVSVMEELIFRGFLWGYLRRLGHSDNLALWTQAIIFWLLHFPNIGSPLVFFITIPLMTIFISLLIRRSGQLFPGIVIHTLANALVISLAPLL